MLQILVRLPRYILIGLVRGYQLIISPHLPKSCRFTPSCSEYALEALRTYGAVKGAILTIYRLGRCHPFGGHGYDPPRWFGEPVRVYDEVETPTDPPCHDLAAEHTP